MKVELASTTEMTGVGNGAESGVQAKADEPETASVREKFASAMTSAKSERVKKEDAKAARATTRKRRPNDSMMMISMHVQIPAQPLEKTVGLALPARLGKAAAAAMLKEQGGEGRKGAVDLPPVEAMPDSAEQAARAIKSVAMKGKLAFATTEAAAAGTTTKETPPTTRPETPRARRSDRPAAQPEANKPQPMQSAPKAHEVRPVEGIADAAKASGKPKAKAEPKVEAETRREPGKTGGPVVSTRALNANDLQQLRDVAASVSSRATMNASAPPPREAIEAVPSLASVNLAQAVVTLPDLGRIEIRSRLQENGALEVDLRADKVEARTALESAREELSVQVAAIAPLAQMVVGPTEVNAAEGARNTDAGGSSDASRQSGSEQGQRGGEGRGGSSDRGAREAVERPVYAAAPGRVRLVM